MGPLQFITYINDFEIVVVIMLTYTYFIMMLKSEQDELVLRENINNFVDWTDKQLMKKNASKCKDMSFNHRRYISSLVPTKYIINSTEL